MKPTESAPEKVPGYPHWVWWPGEHGWPEAKRLNGTGEPIKVRSRNWTELLAKIRKAEGGTRGGSDRGAGAPVPW